MDSFNKVLSFVLGLIVIVVIFAVISSKLKLGDRLGILTLRNPTPTVTLSPTTVPTPTLTFFDTVNNEVSKGGVKQVTPMPVSSTSKVSQIPSTGPELLLPFALSTLLAGAYLKKRS